MSKALVKTDPDVKAKAREMYFAHVGHNSICQQLQLSSSTLANWRKAEDWAAARREADENLLHDLVEGRKVKLARLAEVSVEQIERCISSLRQRVDAPTLHEAEKLSVILANLDKISRLDRQQATENVAVNVNVQGNLSVERIRDVIANDPFFSQPQASLEKKPTE